MPRTRDIVALSAILVAPLVATLIVTRSSHDDTATVAAEPTPVVAVVEPPRVEPAAVEPPKVETPPAPPPVEPPTPATEDKPAEPALERDPGQLMLVVDNDLVLHTGPDVAWSSGKLNIVARSARLSVSKKADLDKLPAPVRAAASSTVTVYDSDGSACVATVGAVRVDSTQTGEVYMGLEVPEGEEFDSAEPPKDRAALRKFAEETFKEPSGKLLLARQKAQNGKPCAGVWARRADLPAPAVFGRRQLGDDEAKALTAKALEVVRAQPEFAQVAAAYAERVKEYGPDAEVLAWPEFVDRYFAATRWDEVGGPRRIVSVQLHETWEGCGDYFDGSIALLFEQQGDALVRLQQPGWLYLDALMDVDRDGVLEGVTNFDLERKLVAAGPNASVFRDETMENYVGCRC